MKKFYLSLWLFLCSNFLFAQLKPITDKGIFQSKLIGKSAPPDPYFPSVTTYDLHINLFNRSILISPGLEGLRPSTLTTKDFPNGIPANVLDVIESVQSMPFEVVTKYFVQKKDEERYEIFALIPIVGEHSIDQEYPEVRYSKVLIDIIDKKQFNLQTYNGKYDLKEITQFGTNSNVANYEYYEDLNYNRIWHGNFSLVIKGNNLGVDDNLQLNIKGQFKHNYRDGEWTFKGTKSNLPIDIKVTYLLGDIIYLEYFGGKQNNQPFKLLELSFEKNTNLKFIDTGGGDFHIMDSYGFLNDKFTKVNGSIEEIWEYESGIEKLYLKRNKSTGEVLIKREINNNEFINYKRIVEVNRKNLPERLDWNFKPTSYISDLYYDYVKGLLLLLLPGDIKGDLTAQKPPVGFYYKFERQQTKAEIEAYQKQENERIEKEKQEEYKKIQEINQNIDKKTLEKGTEFGGVSFDFEIGIWINELTSRQLKEKGIEYLYFYVNNELQRIHSTNDFIIQQPNFSQEKLIKYRSYQYLTQNNSVNVQLKDKSGRNLTNQTALSFKKDSSILYQYQFNFFDILDYSNFIEVSVGISNELRENIEKKKEFYAGKERIVKEQQEKEKLEKEQSIKQQQEKEKLEKERIEQERLQKLKQQQEKEKLERERIEKEIIDYNIAIEQRTPLTSNGSVMIWFDVSTSKKLQENRVNKLLVYFNNEGLKKQHSIYNFSQATPECGSNIAINIKFNTQLPQNNAIKIIIKDPLFKTLATYNLQPDPNKCVTQQFKFLENEQIINQQQEIEKKEKVPAESNKQQEKEKQEKVQTEQEKEQLIKQQQEKEKQEKARLEQEKEQKLKLQQEKEKLAKEKIEKEISDYNSSFVGLMREQRIPQNSTGTVMIWFDENTSKKLQENKVTKLLIYFNDEGILKQHSVYNFIPTAPECGSNNAINIKFNTQLPQNNAIKIIIKDPLYKTLATYNLQPDPNKCAIQEFKF